MEKGVFNQKMRDEEITKRDSFNESFIKKYIKVPVYTLDKMTLLNNPSIEKAKKYCEKYEISYKNEITLLAGLHNERLYTVFITDEEKAISRKWLKENGFKEYIFD